MHDFQTPAAFGKARSRLASCQVEALLRKAVHHVSYELHVF